METAEIVKIAVSAAPYSIDKPYDYLVPPELLETAVPGVRVTVPFGRGNRTSEGIILARTPGEKMQGLKPLLSVLDRGPVLDGDGIALALWLRQRYFCTLFEAVKAILPAGLWYQIREVWHVAEGMDRCAADGAATGIRRASPVLDALFAAGGSAELSVLEEACGREAGTVLRALQKAGITVCETAARRRIGDKSRRMVELAVSAEEAASLTEKRSSPQRREAVRLLAAEGRMSAAEVCYFTGVSMAALRGMEKAGIVAFSAEEELRLPDLTAVEPSGPIVLNEEQEAPVVALPVLHRGVDHIEVGQQQGIETHLSGVILHPHGLPKAGLALADGLVIGVRLAGAVGIAALGIDDAGDGLHQLFHAPEAAARQIYDIFRGIHIHASFTGHIRGLSGHFLLVRFLRHIFLPGSAAAQQQYRGEQKQQYSPIHGVSLLSEKINSFVSPYRRQEPDR